MTQCPNLTHLLIVPRLRVQNANAVSSPLTHGFPAMSAFLGLAWTLERKCRAHSIDVRFSSVGIVCHGHEEQITESGYVRAFRLTRNPVDSKGGTAAIVEEGRIHLDISLVFGVSSQRWVSDPHKREVDAATVGHMLAGMRVAGGSIVRSGDGVSSISPRIIDMTGDEAAREAGFRRIRAALMPGFVMVLRDDLLARRLKHMRTTEPSASQLDAWLTLSRTNWRYEEATSNGNTPEWKYTTRVGISNKAVDGSAVDPMAAIATRAETSTTHSVTDEAPAMDRSDGVWRHDRLGAGWLVPIPVGYGALSPLYSPGTVADTRDDTTPFRFVESLYSIGEWLGPHRLNRVQDMLWYAESDEDSGAYRCRNDYSMQCANSESGDDAEVDDADLQDLSNVILDLDD